MERAVVERMMALASEAAMPRVRAVAELEPKRLEERMREGLGRDDHDRAHYSLLTTEIDPYRARPFEVRTPPDAPGMPPGSPIGDPGTHGGWMTCTAW